MAHWSPRRLRGFTPVRGRHRNNDTKDSCCHGSGRLTTSAHHPGRVRILRVAAPGKRATTIDLQFAGGPDRVHTTSRLQATIAGITDDSVDLEIAPGVVTTWMKLAVRDRIVDDIDDIDDIDDDTDDTDLDYEARESTATEITDNPNTKQD
jgi:hypothetical protein